MPERSIHKIMTATDPADVAQMAMIECLRQIADGNKKTGQVLEGMQTELRDVRERVIRIEAVKVETDIADLRAEAAEARNEARAERVDLRTRIEKLEASEHRREGAMSLTNWVLKNWPAIIGFVAFIVLFVLANNGKLHL